MNESLSKFLDGAQIHAMLGFVASLARVLLAPPAERRVSPWKKVSIVIGSVALAVTIAYAAERVPALKAWSELCSLAVGLLAQDILMRITRRGNALLDRAEDVIDAKTKYHRTRHEYDDDYYR